MNALERLRRYGVLAAVHHKLWRLLYRPTGYAPYVCLALPARSAPRTDAPEADGIACREVPLDELSRYAKDPEYALDGASLPRARARRDCCIGVFDAGKLVSYSFNATIPTDFNPHFQYRFPDGWVYHFRAYTLPAWRGRRLHGRNVSAVIERFRTHPGFKGMVTLVNGVNYPSLASFRRLGFERMLRFAILGHGSKSPSLLAAPSASGHRIERTA